MRKPLFFLSCFCIILIAIELGLIALLSVNARPGEQWLGDTIQNSSDVAVYLSYLKQGADGHVLLSNLFAVEPHAKRFDLVWSLLGLLARAGIPTVIVHELARTLFTVLLVFVVYAAAKRITPQDRDARLATVLSFAGIGFGWIVSVWYSVRNAWTPQTAPAPDVATDMALGPILFGGAHAILSVALLITSLRLIWSAVAERSMRASVIASATTALLLLFHPYFAAILVPFGCIALITHRKTIRKLPYETIKLLLPFIASSIPAAFIFVPLFADPVFRTHHAITNVLPLSPFWTWIPALAPFLIAFYWRYKHQHRIMRQEYWLVAWIGAVIFAVILPLPFKQKLTEGLNVAFVLLTLPAWIAVRDWIWRGSLKTLSMLMSGMFILGASLAPIHLISSQLVWAHKPDKRTYFYVPTNIFDTWDWLHKHANPSSAVLADVMWINAWTPAYTGKTVWIGHIHESPNFETKLGLFRELQSSNDATRVRSILDGAGITHLIVTTDERARLFTQLLGSDWSIAFEKDTIRIFIKKFTPLTLLPEG